MQIAKPTEETHWTKDGLIEINEPFEDEEEEPAPKPKKKPTTGSIVYVSDLFAAAKSPGDINAAMTKQAERARDVPEEPKSILKKSSMQP